MKLLQFHLQANKLIRAGIVLTAAAVLIAAAIVVNRIPLAPMTDRNGVYTAKAVVTSVDKNELTRHAASGYLIGTQQVTLRVTSGAWKGQSFQVTNSTGYTYNLVCKPGTRLIVSISVSGAQKIVSIYSYDRSLPLFLLILLFAVALCLIGGKKGVKALVGTAVTLGCVLFLFIPLLMRGAPPVFLSVVLSVAITFLTLLLIDGINAKSLSAIAGSIVCVSLAGLVSQLFGFFTHISGYSMAAADELVVLSQRNGLQLKGILFASILIASLGAVMDICMSVASAVNEVYIHNPGLSRQELFRAGLHVGQDTMGTMANTLILAFTGSSLTSIMVLSAYHVTLEELFSMPGITVEIIQGMAGSLGVFLAVPIVSFIAAQALPQFLHTFPTPPQPDAQPSKDEALSH